MRRFAFSPIWYAIRPLARSVITERAEGPDFPGWLENRGLIANFKQRTTRRIASRLRSHDPIHAETIGRSYAWMFIKRGISSLAPPGGSGPTDLLHRPDRSPHSPSLHSSVRFNDQSKPFHPSKRRIARNRDKKTRSAIRRLRNSYFNRKIIPSLFSLWLVTRIACSFTPKHASRQPFNPITPRNARP